MTWSDCRARREGTRPPVRWVYMAAGDDNGHLARASALQRHGGGLRAAAGNPRVIDEQDVLAIHGTDDP